MKLGNKQTTDISNHQQTSKIELIFLVRLHHTKSSSYLQGRFELRCFGLTESVLVTEFAKLGTHQSTQSTIFCEEFAGQFKHIVTCGACTQNNGKKFGV